MSLWPDTLPAAPLVEGFQETFPNRSIRTAMEQGPAKVRQRTTAAVQAMTVAFLMSKAQITTLEDFYLTTLQGGALSFDFTHPRTGTTVSCRFVKPPIYGAGNGNYFKVICELEVLP